MYLRSRFDLQILTKNHRAQIGGTKHSSSELGVEAISSSKKEDKKQYASPSTIIVS